MTRTRRNATVMLAMVFVAAVIAPRAGAAEVPGTTGIQAEIQIELCAPADQIVQALDLHPRGTPIKVWQFDDAALVLFGRGLRLRLRVTADGRSEFTLKVADQDCARLGRGLVPSDEGKCEYDAYGTSMAGAVSHTPVACCSVADQYFEQSLLQKPQLSSRRYLPVAGSRKPLSMTPSQSLSSASQISGL